MSLIIEYITEVVEIERDADGNIVKEYIPTLKGDYMAYYDGIYEAIRNNKEVPVTAIDAMHVIKVIEAALKSNKERKVIDL